MSEYRRQSDFLRVLLDYDDSAESRGLQDRLAVAECNERCLFSACRSVALIAAFGLSGLGYAAVLLPEFFDSSSHFLVQLFSALLLGSTMCLVVFVGVWLGYRSAANKVRAECRASITQLLEARLRPQACRATPVIGQAPYLAIHRGDAAHTLQDQGPSPANNPEQRKAS